MNLENVLIDIETMLIGKELQPIHQSTGVLYVTKIDRVAGKYFVYSPKDKKTIGRTISTELGAIVNDLNRRGFCNVDQSLYGSGSSRNHPETIFANLPYIQHFKYKNKKHILLREEMVHETGTLSEVQGASFRTLRKQIDNYLDLDLELLNNKQEKIIQDLYDAYDIVLKKYSAELSVLKIEQSLKNLKLINKELSDSVVCLDRRPSDNILTKDKESLGYVSIEDSLDTPENTGVDIGEDNIIDGDDLKKQLFAAETKLGVAKIRMMTPTLSLIFDRVEFKDIELQPDFQRKDRIWKADKKSKLVESILMRLPLPVFYFGEKLDSSWIVVDGLQRTTSIYDFMSNKFPLANLEILSNLNGKYFKDLSRTEQRDIREYAITAYLIDVDERNSNLVVELFHRINTYGVKLSDQEIRSALNQGSSVKFLRFLASLNSFKEATRYKVKPDRQKDMELCLSALSFMVRGYKDYGQGSYDSFLSGTMSYLNAFELHLENEDDIDNGNSIIRTDCKEYIEIYEKYDSALKLAKEIFGDFAFVKEPISNSSPISKQLFELVIYYFSKMSPAQREILRKNASEFIDHLYTAIEENSKEYADWHSKTYNETDRGFKDALSTSTGKRITVLYRFEAFAEILKTTTGIVFDYYDGENNHVND